MQDKTIELMAPEIKEWFAKAIVGMILADGRINKAEIEYLNNLIGFLDDQISVKNISQMLDDSQMPTLEPIDLEANQALEIIKHLTVLAVVDEDLSNREVRFLKHVADRLGLPSTIPDRFLSLGKEKLRRARYMARITTNEFSEQVRCFDLTRESCMFYAFHDIQGGTQLTLQFYQEGQSQSRSPLFQIVVGEASWSRPVKSKYGNYVVSIRFNNPLDESQGLELIKYIQPAGDDS